MELQDDLKTALTVEAKAPQKSKEAETELAERPLPNNLRLIMIGLLVVGVIGVVGFGYVRQTSVKPPAQTASTDSCKDPLTENRLRETLKQSPNDFPTLMDWGSYNLNCAKNYQIATAAFNQAVTLANQPNTTIKPMERGEAQFRLGLAYLYNQNFDGARGQFEAIIKDDPKNSSALLALGASYEKDNPQKAIDYFKQVIAVDPNSDFAKNAQQFIDDMSQPTPSPAPKK